MNFRLIARTSIFILFLATLAVFLVQKAQAAECVKSSIFRVGTNIVATAKIDGQVTFYANGKVVSNCKNKLTTSKSVTCVRRPLVYGRNLITATIVSSSFSSYTGSFTSSTQIARRSSNR